ncbi:MAG: hypothetical protein K8R79_02215, partial [Calditrichales bacterium]|nr:hypothetical protein [Calditrichales bacterium]
QGKLFRQSISDDDIEITDVRVKHFRKRRHVLSKAINNESCLSRSAGVPLGKGSLWEKAQRL